MTWEIEKSELFERLKSGEFPYADDEYLQVKIQLPLKLVKLINEIRQKNRMTIDETVRTALEDFAMNNRGE